ncbi:MAG: T9SS type A sorting domain-containing protein [Candidatus Cloacimonetes bacterium]|nr:T9SS type A sorting domain-containing protein [Candidatus Cloacimonadota bacterium]
MKKIIISLIILISFSLVLAEDYHDVSMTPSLKVTVLINGDADVYEMQSWSAQLYSTDGTAVGTAVVGNTTPGAASNIEGCYFGVNSVDTSMGYITIDVGNLGYNYRRYRTTTALGGQTEYIQVIPETGHDESIPRYVEGEYTYNTSGVLTDGPTLRITYNLGGRADETVDPGNTAWSGGYIGLTEENLTFSDDGDGWGEGGILPVTLSSFTAVLTDGTPQLQWITQSEINNAGWNIFRSETGLFEESVRINNEFISGAGTTSQPTDYAYLDEYEVTDGATYSYWLESIAFSGTSDNYGPITLKIPEDGNNQSPEVPIVYGLHQNYPNPFNPDTYISFALEETGPAKIDIYNIRGQKVINLFDEDAVNKDSNISVYWNGCDSNGTSVASGIYFYRLEANGETHNRKMVLTK